MIQTNQGRLLRLLLLGLLSLIDGIRDQGLSLRTNLVNLLLCLPIGTNGASLLTNHILNH
jgi:hypothetical protein